MLDCTYLNEPIRGYNKTSLPFLWKVSEWYLDSKRKGYKVINVNSKTLTIQENSKNHFLLSCIKIASYFTVLLPLMALCLRAHYRKQYTFMTLDEIKSAKKSKLLDQKYKKKTKQLDSIKKNIQNIKYEEQIKFLGNHLDELDKLKEKYPQNSAKIDELAKKQLNRFKPAEKKEKKVVKLSTYDELNSLHRRALDLKYGIAMYRINLLDTSSVNQQDPLDFIHEFCLLHSLYLTLNEKEEITATPIYSKVLRKAKQYLKTASQMLKEHIIPTLNSDWQQEYFNRYYDPSHIAWIAELE